VSIDILTAKARARFGVVLFGPRGVPKEDYVSIRRPNNDEVAKGVHFVVETTFGEQYLRIVPTDAARCAAMADPQYKDFMIQRVQAGMDHDNALPNALQRVIAARKAVLARTHA